jgi:hypothetical protein
MDDSLYVSEDRSEMTWTHAVLELYELSAGWPKEGNPAQWIHDDLVVLVPLTKILVWKLKHFAETLRWSLTWRFRKEVDTEAWDILSDEALHNFERQLGN